MHVDVISMITICWLVVSLLICGSGLWFVTICVSSCFKVLPQVRELLIRSRSNPYCRCIVYTPDSLENGEFTMKNTRSGLLSLIKVHLMKSGFRRACFAYIVLPPGNCSWGIVFLLVLRGLWSLSCVVRNIKTICSKLVSFCALGSLDTYPYERQMYQHLCGMIYICDLRSRLLSDCDHPANYMIACSNSMDGTPTSRLGVPSMAFSNEGSSLMILVAPVKLQHHECKTLVLARSPEVLGNMKMNIEPGSTSFNICDI